MSCIDLRGTIESTTARRSTLRTLVQTVGDIEAREFDVTIPHAGNLTLPLGFSAGVTEALILCIYSPKKVTVTITTTATDAGGSSGPCTFGLKGTMFLSCPPGEGIATVKVKNLSETEDITIEYMVGTKSVAFGADPPYFDDDQ